VLLLNPQAPLHPGVLFSLGWRLGLTAGLLLAAAFFFASLVRYLSTRRGPGWLSLRLLAWMTTLVVGLGALLAWLDAHPDVRSAGVCPYFHFLAEGKKEGRSTKSAGQWPTRNDVRLLVQQQFDGVRKTRI
jgi:hypothetical protein